MEIKLNTNKQLKKINIFYIKYNLLCKQTNKQLTYN